MTQAPLTVGIVSKSFADSTAEGRTSGPPMSTLKGLLDIGVRAVALATAADALSSDVDLLHLQFADEVSHEVASRTRTPYVVTLHEGADISAVTDRDPEFPYARGWMARRLRGDLLRSASSVVALCDREAASLREAYDVERQRIHVIPNGIDVDAYGVGGSSSGPPVVLAVGQLRPHKGYRYLLEAASQLITEGVSVKFRLINHRADDLPKYLALVSQLGLDGHVEFLAGMTSKELAAEYSKADMYVHPSLAECAPTTILEAMASGLPVVATNIACIDVQLGSCGVTVPPRSSGALAVAIAGLARDPARRASMGECARTRCRDLFGLEQSARELSRVYETALRERAATPSRGYPLLVSAYCRWVPRARRLARLILERIAPRWLAQRRARIDQWPSAGTQLP